MLAEYESKRMEYNLALNELNKFKKNYEDKEIKLTKEKFEDEYNNKQKNVSKLKRSMEDYFNDNQDKIALEMLKDYFKIADEYNYYTEELVTEDDKNYLLKKSKEEISEEIDEYKDKLQKRLDNKVITSIVYNDLIKCLDVYYNNLIKEWKNIDDRKFVSIQEKKAINKKNVKKSKNQNLIFNRLMLPLIILNIICLVFMLIRNGECYVSGSNSLDLALCAFMVVSKLCVYLLTPINVVYLIVRCVKTKDKIKKKG